MNIVDKIAGELLKTNIPQFRSGDTVCVHAKIKEGDKERIQTFEGIVIKKHKGSKNATFTVRKTSYGVGVERVFPLHSPLIDRIEVVTRGKVRRSRLYYLRKRSGKSARVRERAYEEVMEVANETPEGAATETPPDAAS